MDKAGFAVIVALVLLVNGAPSPIVYSGHNITYSGTEPGTAYLVETSAPHGAVHLDAWEVHLGKTIRSYDVDMTKLQHMIVVSDDLSDFQHVHPILNANGHFTIDVLAKKRELYHVYIDGIPHGLGRAVYRFDIPMGSSAAAPERLLHAAGNSQHAGPYTVTLDPVVVPFGEIATIDVTISKHGKEATDLHPYLGAMAHGVFVGTKDLAYMHAHGMSEAMLAMSQGDCGDSMMLSMPPLPATVKISGAFAFEILAPSGQSYNFWLQFIGDKTLYTVPFLVTTP